MDNLLLVAVAKWADKQAKGIKLGPGQHSVAGTVTLDVSGTISKGQDVEFAPTVAIPLLPTLALVLEKAGFMREHAATLLVSAMTEALELENQGEQAIKDRCKLVDEAMTRVRAVVGSLPKKTRTGPTKVDVQVTVS